MKEQQENTARNEECECPACGTVIDMDDNFCRYCGAAQEK